MGAIWAICVKDIRLLLRDRMGFFFAFGFPILIAIFFGTIFGHDEGDGKDSGKVDVLLVDEDQTDGSRSFARTLHGASELKVTDEPTRTGAMDKVRTSKATAFVALPKGFGATRDSMFWGGGTSIVVGVDPARRAESGMLEGILTKYGFMQLQEGFQKPDLMRSQVKKSLDRLNANEDVDPVTRATLGKFFGDLDEFLTTVPAMPKASDAKGSSVAGPGAFQPIKIEKADVTAAPAAETEKKSPSRDATANPPRSPYSWTFPQGMIWGFIGCAMSFTVAMVLERTKGTLLRLRVAPLGPMQVLAGKALACFLMTQIVAVLLVLIGRFVFGMQIWSVPTLAVAIVCTGLCFMGIMLLTSVISKSERASAGLGWGVMLIFSMIGGGMIPLFVLKGWMQSLSMLSPVRWSILALEGGIWRQMTPLEMLPACAILVGIGVAGFVAGAMVFGKSDSA